MAKRRAGANSLRQYERGASRMIRASARGSEGDATAALPQEQVVALLDYLGKGKQLRDGTVSHYVQCARVAIARILGPDEKAVEQASAQARDLLARRARKQASPRRDPSVEELGDVFSHFRWKYMNGGKDPTDLLLALYIIVMPRIGLRPVEMTWTEWDGNGLYTYTAKRAGRPKRYIPQEHWPPVYKAALGLFVKLVPREFDDESFEAWRNLLASRLARASKRSRTGERLPLYFARHIAFANWKAAGITPAVIAQLAGHAGLRSQQFYASGRSGYGSRYVFLDTEEAKAALKAGLEPGANAEAGQAGVVGNPTPENSVPDARQPPEGEESAVPPQNAKPLFWEDPPAPKGSKAETPDDQGGRLWEEHVQRANADLDGSHFAPPGKKRAFNEAKARTDGGDKPEDTRNASSNSKPRLP